MTRRVYRGRTIRKIPGVTVRGRLLVSQLCGAAPNHEEHAALGMTPQRNLA